MKLLVLGGIHGNEPLGIELVKLLQQSPVPGVTAVSANPRAVRRNVRFIESDLNRSFGTNFPGTYETRRARRLARICAGYDLVLDFHNTHCPDNDCTFVGTAANQLLYDASSWLGLKRVIVADYDCLNKYAPNCVSVEISLSSPRMDARQWVQTITELASMDTLPEATELELYKFVYRITTEDRDRLKLREKNLQAFRAITPELAQQLKVASPAYPIFIGDGYTPYNFGGLLNKITDIMEPDMTLSTQPYKGARDFYPEDKRLQKYMFAKMRQVSGRFGYEEYDAPILEPTELYLSKGNQEIIDEQTYTFTDRGGRSVTIRTEMTPTVSRMVAARRQELAYPVRWYSIPNLWRYERTQRGRLREFWQYNADIFGVEGVEADHEIIVLADQIMRSYGARPDMYAIYVSSRKLIDELFGDYLGLDNTQRQTLIRLIDRIKKIPYEAFTAQADAILTPSQRDEGVLDRLLGLLKTTELKDLPEAFAGNPSVLRLRQLMDMLGSSKITNAVFDITLMRGFDYYTDMVFEVFDTDPENNRSMFGGGRYDGLVGAFGAEPVPVVGFGMGDVTLQNFLESHGLLPKLATETDVYVVLVSDLVYEKAQPVLADLRSMGINVAVDTSGRKLDKQIKAAVKKGVPYALFIGDAELASGQYKLRNLADGTEDTHGVERIVSIVRDYRRAGQTLLADEDV